MERLDGLDVAHTLPLDVTDDASVEAARAAAGDIDVLVNNAALGVMGPVEEMPLVDIQAMYDTNVFGALRMVHAFVPAMRERGRGHVVNVSSIAARWTVEPFIGPYSSTKAALDALTETMWIELARFGVRVSLVSPGYTATNWATNEQWVGTEGPYAELHDQVVAADEAGQARAAAAEVVASTIADAIDADDPDRLRWPGDQAAADIVSLRTSYDDAAWERIVKDEPAYDW